MHKKGRWNPHGNASKKATKGRIKMGKSTGSSGPKGYDSTPITNAMHLLRKTPGCPQPGAKWRVIWDFINSAEVPNDVQPVS